MSTDPTGKSTCPDHELTRLYLLSSKQHGGAGQPHDEGRLPAVPQSASTPLPSSGRCGPIWTIVVDARQRTAAIRKCRTPGRHTLCRHPAPATAWAIPEDSRRHLHSPENNPVSVQPGSELLSDLRANDKSTRHHAALPRIIRLTRPIYPSYVCRRPTRMATISPAFGCAELNAAPGDLHGLGDCGSGVLGRTTDATASGQYIPFAATTAGRTGGKTTAACRFRSVTPSFGFYKTQVVLAVDTLVRDRFLICDDTQDIVNRLAAGRSAAGVPAPGANERHVCSRSGSCVPGTDAHLAITIITSTSVIGMETITARH